MINSMIAILITMCIITPITYLLDLSISDGPHNSFIVWVFIVCIASVSGLISSKLIEILSNK